MGSDMDGTPPVAASPVADDDFEPSRQLAHHGTPRPIREILLELAEATDPDLKPAHYGEGEVVERLEARVATLLGKEAAVFLPSGTMAQQIALRIWCDRAGTNHVAFHPLCHLEIHEQNGYRRLHGLHSTLLGTAERMFTMEDLEKLSEPVGAILFELPQREIGGQLPAWDDLVAMVGWARDRGMATHLDGARLWETRPFYGREYSEIAALFDSVYVSFYKILGGIAGAALAGPADMIKEARLWQRRHGGNLVHLYPMTLSAEVGLGLRLERVADYHRKALEVAALLTGLPGVRVVPDPPHTNMMHVFLQGDKQRLLAAQKRVAREHDVDLFSSLTETIVPDVHRFELTLGDASLQFSGDQVRELFEALMAYARE
ncbi:MAG: beta-eliminating lyase-related protein [Thermoanaerobaculales bacterium]|nr:beta-eliminating lyase-related protein [Thermoanaerobaculales bacterium]